MPYRVTYCSFALPAMAQPVHPKNVLEKAESRPDEILVGEVMKVVVPYEAQLHFMRRRRLAHYFFVCDICLRAPDLTHCLFNLNVSACLLT